MILTTTDTVPGREIASYCGLAKGCAVRALNAGDDLVATFKDVVGGEVHEFTEILAQAREQALDRLVADAQSLGADAVVGLRLVSVEIGSGMAEMLAYGTAVKMKAK